MKITIDIDIEHVVNRETRKISYVAKHGVATMTGRSQITGMPGNRRPTSAVVGWGDSLDEALADLLQKLADRTRDHSMPPARAT